MMNVQSINPDLWGDGARGLVMNIENISLYPWGGGGDGTRASVMSVHNINSYVCGEFLWCNQFKCRC